MEKLSDKICVEKVLNGETEHFACLLKKYSKQVFSLIVQVVGNREDAEELTQDVFVKVYSSLARFRGESCLSTWIYRIAYNQAISAVRKSTVQFMTIDEQVLAGLPDDVDEEAFGASDKERRIHFLQNALEMLPPDERALITLFYKDNLSMEEIALITKLTVTNVKTKICRIRKKLFVLIKKMEDEENG